ncbi:MAG: collagen binding domain-containing protein, partial [Acutalibacteraceae bacterium]
LRYGRYTYEEFDAPDGYLIDTTPHEFEITEDGQVIKAEMTNEKIPVTEIPQTSDDSLTEVWLGLAAVALGGLIALAVVRFRKKKDEGGE